MRAMPLLLVVLLACSKDGRHVAHACSTQRAALLKVAQEKEKHMPSQELLKGEENHFKSSNKHTFHTLLMSGDPLQTPELRAVANRQSVVAPRGRATARWTQPTAAAAAAA